MSDTNQQTAALNASARIMMAEAEQLGIHCVTFDDHETILMTKDDHQWYVRGSRTSFQSSVGKTIADYKPLTKQILHHFQIPTAQSCLVKKADELKQLSSLTFPVVMKPVSDRHGKGVVVNIKTIDEAEQLFRKADQTMLFEEMLHGTEYRVVCVDYKFVATAFRKPAHVTGDGKHTIQELIDEKNKHPWRGKGHQNNLSLIEVDDTLKSNLGEQWLELTSVPKANQEVLLRKTANLSTGGEAWDVSAQVCDENKKLFERIAKVCDLNVIGIDVMCDDLAKPIVDQSHAGVIEVNASPGLRMHHFPMQGKPINIAKIILDSVLKKLTS